MVGCDDAEDEEEVSASLTPCGARKKSDRSEGGGSRGKEEGSVKRRRRKRRWEAGEGGFSQARRRGGSVWPVWPPDHRCLPLATQIRDRAVEIPLGGGWVPSAREAVHTTSWQLRLQPRGAARAPKGDPPAARGLVGRRGGGGDRRAHALPQGRRCEQLCVQLRATT